MTDVGDVIPAYGVTVVDAARMKVMALLLRDPNAIHFDEAAVAQLGLGDRVVNQGPINLAYVQNMLARWAGGLDRVLATDVRFLATVFAGDALQAGGRVTAVVDEDGRRLAACEVWLDVVDGARALHGTARVVVD